MHVDIDVGTSSSPIATIRNLASSLVRFFLNLYRHARKDMTYMAKFVSREKLSKKVRKELDSQKRTVWGFSPTTRKVKSKNSTTVRNALMPGRMTSA